MDEDTIRSDEPESIHLEWETVRDLPDGSALTSSLCYSGSVRSLVEMCDELPGFGASKLIREAEKVAASMTE